MERATSVILIGAACGRGGIPVLVILIGLFFKLMIMVYKQSCYDVVFVSENTLVQVVVVLVVLETQMMRMTLQVTGPPYTPFPCFTVGSSNTVWSASPFLLRSFF